MEIDRDALLQVFVTEASDHLDRMEERLLALESAEDKGEELKSIFRRAHTIKGGAQTVGFEAMGTFTHEVEELLSAMRGRPNAVSADLVTELLEAVDLVRRMLADASAGHDALSPAATAHIQRLRETSARVALLPVTAPEGASSEAVRATAPERGVRVPLSKLDRLLDLTGELGVARERLGVLIAASGDAGLRAAHDDEARLHAELQELVLAARTVPVGSAMRPFMRVVRDTAEVLGKQARLVIRGGDVEVDTAVFEAVRDPLTHLMRNALDHGIELPAERARRGKDPCGTLTLLARHDEGQVAIELSDDGGGFDRDRILAKATAAGLVAPGTKLTEGQIDDLAFTAGFSTAEEVTALSGRGVGLDVVRRNIEALRGSVQVRSQRGQGTTLTLRFPLTLAIIRGFRVAQGAEVFVLPLESVLECVDLAPEARPGEAAQGVYALRGQALPYLRLGQALGRPGSPGARQTLVVLAGPGGKRVGLAVDAALGESQAVIKPLGSLFRDVPGVAGSTLLGDGRIALLLDVAALVRRAEVHAASRSPSVSPEPSP